MHAQRALFVACAILLQTAWAFSTIPPGYESPSKGLDGIRSPQDLHSPLAQMEGHGHPRTLSMARSSKRDDEEEDHLRIRRIDILTSAVPIIGATHHLEIFYNFLLYNALETWANMPHRYCLSISLGCLQLSMSVVMNIGPPRGIPWAFVRNFARNMIIMTRMGFAGTYVMYYTSIRGAFVPEFGVEVRLRVCWTGIGRQRRSFPRAIDFSQI